MACIVESYSNFKLHAEIGGIIKKHSTNKMDIREVLIGLIDGTDIGHILDLGCGYGWFEKALSAARPLLIAGVDCMEENRRPFTAVAGKFAEKVIFQQTTLPAMLGFPADYFDLVVSAYSLYFFPAMLAEVKRVLRPGGAFAVITHSEAMMEEGERFFDFKNLRKIIRSFSAENGEALLAEYFNDIRAVDYNNSLLFHSSDEEDLTIYIDFKKEFIREDADPGLVKRTMLDHLREKGEVRFNKNDRIFIAKK